MSWRFESAGPGFQGHAPAWDALNREHGNHILLDSRFVALLIRCFGTPATTLAVSTRAESRGLVLLERGRLGFASTFQPSQSPLGLLLLESRDRALPMARDLLRALPGYTLGLSILQQDPDATLFPAEGLRGAAERVDYIDTGRLRLSGTFDEYWNGRSKNLTHNLRRQRRRLADDAKTLALRIVREPERVAECVAAYGRLEGSGWKAAGGTAVASENAQGVFYRDVLETFMKSGEGTIFELTLDGEIIASDLCLERDGTMVILKTAYDASLKGLSPGLLLHEEILRHLFAANRIRVVEFYGRAREWHTKFTEEFRRMYHLNLYRGSWVARARAVVRDAARILKRKDQAPPDAAAG